MPSKAELEGQRTMEDLLALQALRLKLEQSQSIVTATELLQLVESEFASSPSALGEHRTQGSTSTIIRRTSTISPFTSANRERGEARLRQKLEAACRLDLLLNQETELGHERLEREFGVHWRSRREKTVDQSEKRRTAAFRRRAHLQRHKTDSISDSRFHREFCGASYTQEELNQGMYALKVKDRIPRDADLSPYFLEGTEPTIRSSTIRLHDFQERFTQPIPTLWSFTPHLNQLKLDLTHSSAPPAKLPIVSAPPQVPPVSLQPSSGILQSRSSSRGLAQAPQISTQNPELQEAVIKIRDYTELLDCYSLHQFLIRDGRAQTAVPEFVSYKKMFWSQWGSIERIICILERFLTNYDIHIAYIDGAELAKLSRNEVDKRPSLTSLLRCISNIDQVMSQLSQPGRQYQGGNREERAAVAIQSVIRMHLQSKDYNRFMNQMDMATKIQSYWKSFITSRQNQRELISYKKQRKSEWKATQLHFVQSWSDLRTSPRIEIHVPSFSAKGSIRKNMEYLSTLEGEQITRIFSLRDPLLTIVLVLPYQINEFIIKYYYKLLDLQKISNYQDRLKFLYPENSPKFPRHFSLAMMTWLSPNCLRQIRKIVADHPAYIVPDMVGIDDYLLATELNVWPTSKSIVHLRSKSGSKRVFSMTALNVPYGVHDLYDPLEFYSALGHLILKYLHIERWMFKTDDSIHSRGLAYFDTLSLPVIEALRKEKKFNSVDDREYWSHPEVQADAEERVMEKLPLYLKKYTHFVSLKCPDFDAFVSQLKQNGGVIEAVPTRVKGNPLINFRLDPDGHCTILSTHEPLFSSPYVCDGYVFPQQSSPPDVVVSTTETLCMGLIQQSLFGFFSLSLLYFYDYEDQKYCMWAIDLGYCYHKSLVSFFLFDFLSNGLYSASENRYHIVPSIASSVLHRNQSFPPRVFVAFDRIYHPSFSGYQFNTFFNLCRVRNISFDFADRLGSLFLLYDSLAAGCVGNICSGAALADCLQTMGKSLLFLSNELGPHEDANLSVYAQLIRSTIKQLMEKTPPWERRLQPVAQN